MITVYFRPYAFIVLILLVGRQEEHPVPKKLSDEVYHAGVVIYLEQSTVDLHTVQLMPRLPPQSSLASLKSRMILPFWHLLTQVVLEKRPLNGYSTVYFRHIVSNSSVI